MIKKRVIIRRLGIILGVLVKYGFAEALHRLRRSSRLPFRFRRQSPSKVREERARPLAVRLRLACEELGPTYIKFGQMLSMRPDILPQNIIVELEKLQDQVPAFALEHVREIIESQFGKPLEKIYKTFRAEPEAAASIAQVHWAELLSGEEVAVKIQRPGIRDLVAVDLEILKYLAVLAERHLEELAVLGPSAVVKEFASIIQREMDFLMEGRSIESFRKNFMNVPHIRIPRVYWDYCTEKIITMEYIHGIKIHDLIRTRPAGYDFKLIAQRGVDFLFRQVFEFGFFHAYPHAGNIFILPDNVIAPLDFGMVGFVNEFLQERLGRALSAFVNRDAEGLVKVLHDMELLEDRLMTRDLYFDVEHLINYYHNISLAQLNMGTVIFELIDLVRRHHIRVPSHLVLLGKAVGTIEALGKELDPDIDIGETAKPYASKLMMNAVNPLKKAKDLTRFLTDANDLLRSFPDEIAVILKKLRTDKLKLRFEHSGLDPYIKDIDKTGNRLAASIIIAGFLVGSSLITYVDKGPTLFGIPLIGFIGYTLAGLLGLWVIVGIIRSGKL